MSDESWKIVSSPESCQHENAYYYGDTNPVTYYCPDCGIYFVNPDSPMNR